MKLKLFCSPIRLLYSSRYNPFPPLTSPIMARIYGLFGGIVTGLSVTYLTAVKIRKNTYDVCSELQLSQLLAENKPVIARPYTDPINLETRTRKDIIVDLWDSEVIKAIQWIYSLGKA